MNPTPLNERIEMVRRFNRFYTRQIGVLSEGLLRTPYSLTEARVIFELSRRKSTTASRLGVDLGIDAGYMSRIVRGLEKGGLLRRARSKRDRRERLLGLTARGRKVFGTLNSRARREVRGMLEALPAENQNRLLGAMETIRSVLEPGDSKLEPYLLRPVRPGDIGWVIHRHGVLYAEEYGWDESFEALVARILGDFVKNLDPQRERSWIAEADGQIVGSVFCVKGSKTMAKLRLLLVEPRCRGMGVGSRLVDECIRFARQAGYRKLSLWTNSVLHAARRIYERAGFELVKEERHQSFGENLTGQFWELDLRR
jgi:DNA-binding MarR family transcriptional regulator/GNAT superfamily N-acetyltransferase